MSFRTITKLLPLALVLFTTNSIAWTLHDDQPAQSQYRQRDINQDLIFLTINGNGVELAFDNSQYGDQITNFGQNTIQQSLANLLIDFPGDLALSSVLDAAIRDQAYSILQAGGFALQDWPLPPDPPSGDFREAVDELVSDTSQLWDAVKVLLLLVCAFGIGIFLAKTVRRFS